jgi:peptidoglycan hydrolase FlgJ
VTAPLATPSAAGQGLEAVLLRQMIGAMRSATTSEATSDAERQFRDMFDARLADILAAQAGGLGIGRMIDRQIGAIEAGPPP